MLVPLRNTLRRLTRDAPGPVAVHWGGDAITGYEVREAVFGDAQYALGSLFLVAVLVFVQLRSPFLAMYAMYELLIAFPAVYGVYMYACQLETVNLLTGVALFLVIGTTPPCPSCPSTPTNDSPSQASASTTCSCSTSATRAHVTCTRTRPRTSSRTPTDTPCWPHLVSTCAVSPLTLVTHLAPVTSLTTAAAFLANLFSQIPALRMFGEYLPN